MTDNERMQLAEAFHMELREAKVSHIICVEESDKKSFTGSCTGSWRDFIKMIALMIDICSKQIGVSKRKLCKDLVAVALGGKEKKK